jgi:asparagine synthase (glutamine-hydrolysing)
VCGIAGFTGDLDRPVLERMVQSIYRRGPDDLGLWEAPGVSLGMRRLAIIDVAGGSQPMFNEDYTVAIVFNGEIYNHVELQSELVAAGHKFRSHHSDTETVVHLYEEYGLNFLNKLNGMFAVALWDVPRRRLLLARDRTGIKPLYFATTRTGVAFGSEIKAVLNHPDISREPDFSALYDYFTFKNIPSPNTAYASIKQLQPGELAIIEGKEIKRQRWWQVRFAEDVSLTEEDAAGRIRSLLEDSVRLQMRSDVPFGAYLSGGVDSSSVVALMSRITGAQVKTFALTYAPDIAHKGEDQRFARMVSQQYSTEHHEYCLSAQEAVDSIDTVLGAFDEPFSGVTSTYFLTQLISQHVKVALSGDGADELFGSYRAHRVAQPLHELERIRTAGRSLSEADAALLRPFDKQIDELDRLLARGDEVDRRMALYLWDDAAKRTLLSPKMLALVGGASSRQKIADVYGAAGTSDPLNRALYCDFATLLPDQVLAFVDRLSMAHSVEVRPPFLDHRLVEFAATIPGWMKIKDGREKSILKKAVQGLIPDEILWRKKEGFVLPVDQWLLGELRARVEAALSPKRLASHGLLRPERVRLLLDEHYAGTSNHGPRIWNLLMFQIWWEKTYGAS